MNIMVLGTGYVGLVTGACFAKRGHNVICVDIDEKKIKNLKSGTIPIYEPGLETIVHETAQAGKLHFTTDLAQGMKNTQICIIAVPTPPQSDGSCNFFYILEAAKSIALLMTNYQLIIVKSTVPVGCSQKIRKTILAHQRAEVPFDIVSNPEFLKEGAAVADCLHPDRIILGIENPHAENIMREIYKPFHLSEDQILIMDPPSAEMTKYAANAMLATRISFMNELAGLCERNGANIHAVQQGIGSDPRIGKQFLSPGVGYGGSCFPKDIRALAAMASEKDYDTPLLSAVHTVNEKQKTVLFKKIVAYFKGTVQDKTIAIWGLAFKPDTDDLREAPALKLIEALLEARARIRLYDPIAMPKAQNLLSHPNITWCQSPYDAATNSDAIALLTEWKEFISVDFSTLLKSMKGEAFFDGRNLYAAEEMANHGFHYFGIGIPVRSPSASKQLKKLRV